MVDKTNTTNRIRRNAEIIHAAVGHAAHNLVMLDPEQGESQVDFTARRLQYFLTDVIQRGGLYVAD
jgi:hypothetical protein